MPEHEQKEEEFSFKSYFVPFTTIKAIHFIILIGLIVFFNGVFNGFVGDDFLQITDNPIIHSISNFPQFFSGGTFFSGGGQKLGGAFYRPIPAAMFSLIYTFFGAGAFGFHFILIILYIVNACFVFLVFKQFFKKSIAFLLALIFLVHPINSEVALYNSDMQEALFFFFGIISLWTIQRFNSKKAILTVSILLFLSLLSKETGVLFLFISSVYIFIFKRKDFSRWIMYTLPFVVIYIGARISAIGFLTKTIANAPIEKLDFSTRLLNIPEIFIFYLKTFIFPIQVSSSYQWVITTIDFNHFYLPLLFDLLFLGGIAGFAIFLYKKHSHKFFTIYIFFAIWFLAGILIHLQLIPLDKTVALRWFYFPIVGTLGMIGVLLEVFHINLKNSFIIISVFLLLLLLSIRTFYRSFDYRDEFTLVSHDIQISQDAYDLEYNLSFVYFQQGNFEEAKIHALRSIKLFPNTGNYTSLGVAYFSLGEYKSAKKAFIKGLQYGDYYQTYENLAGLALFYGDSQTSINFIKNEALPRYPQDGSLWTDLAILEYTKGDKSDAKESIIQASTYTQSSLTVFAYEAIMNDKPLHLSFKNGQVVMNN